MTPEPSRARTIKPEPYTGPIYRIEGKDKGNHEVCGWVPIEQYSSPQTAETRLRYWKHEFPFKDMFVWRVNEQAESPKP